METQLNKTPRTRLKPKRQLEEVVLVTTAPVVAVQKRPRLFFAAVKVVLMLAALAGAFALARQMDPETDPDTPSARIPLAESAWLRARSATEGGNY